MYEFIRGKVHSMLPGTVILESAGVGYRISVPLSTSGKIKGKGAEALLLVHHTINADQGEERLYGFLTDKERDLFRALTTVKGIGPSTAISVMCAANPAEIIQHIANSDVAALKKFKGVGPKSAERIVAELRDAMGKWTLPNADAARATHKRVPGEKGQDAVLALVNLGYPQAKSEKAVSKAIETSGKNATTEYIVRQALQLV